MKRDSTDTANTKKNSLGWHRKRSFLCLRSDCQKPLKTIEQVFIDPLSVTDVEKRRGEVEPFDYDKLCSGLQKASTRLHRTKDIKDMALQVAEDLRHQEFPHDRTPGRPARYQTSSKTIGDTVLRVLANHSQSTWFVRFCMQFHRLDRQTLQLPALLDTVGHDFAASLTNNTMHPATSAEEKARRIPVHGAALDDHFVGKLYVRKRSESIQLFDQRKILIGLQSAATAAHAEHALKKIRDTAIAELQSKWKDLPQYQPLDGKRDCHIVPSHSIGETVLSAIAKHADGVLWLRFSIDFFEYSPTVPFRELKRGLLARWASLYPSL